MTTTADMLLRIADCLLFPRYSLSTAAGLTTTLIDTTLDEPDELFDGGTIFFITGNLAGKTARITSWDLLTSTFTFPAQSLAPGVGAQYAVLDARYPRDLLIASLNAALHAIGPFDGYNDTLVVVADQRVYTLPAGVSHVKRVQYSNEIAAPYTYGEIDHWWREANGVLYLSANHLQGVSHLIRLWYPADHARVYLDTDVVTSAVAPERLAWTAAWIACRARNARADTTDPQTKELEQKCGGQVAVMARQHPVIKMPTDSRWIDV
jgi:hypothetical protein